MKFTLSWLKDHIDTDCSVDEIADKFTNIGFELESLTRFDLMRSGLVIAHVIEARPHPNADKLSVCRVSDGKQEFQVVCGAPNAKSGMKAVLARAGLTIPGGPDGKPMVLKETEIRNQRSSGMLVSEKELLLSDEHEGIIDCGADAPVGADYAQWSGTGDPVFDLAITPNRPDALGVRALARELFAADMGNLRPLDDIGEMGDGGDMGDSGGFSLPASSAHKMRWRIDKGMESSVPYVGGCVIEGVDVTAKTPKHIGQRLLAIGQRLINPVVDSSNYLMIDRCRPTHVYDLDKVAGDELLLRRAKQGEEFTSLEDKTYKLDERYTVIADSQRIQGLGGIMGGLHSAVESGSQRLFLESALFDKREIMQNGKRLKLESDARHRFERGIDPQSAVWGVGELARLIVGSCGGEVGHFVSDGKLEDGPKKVFMRYKMLNETGGVEIKPQLVNKIFSRLGFKQEEQTKGGKGVEVAPPSWRQDLEGEPCLIEEVLRIWGYNNIKGEFPTDNAATNTQRVPFAWRIYGMMRRSLAAFGLDEQVNWSFCDPELAKPFVAETDKNLLLINPLNSDLSLMRPSLLPHLLARLSRSRANFEDVTGFFELGPVFSSKFDQAQSPRLAGVLCSAPASLTWSAGADGDAGLDVYSAKAAALSALRGAGIDERSLRQARTGESYLHPGRQGGFFLGKKLLASFGELHPSVAKVFALKGRIGVFEIMLDNPAIAKRKSKPATRQAFSAKIFPPADRDFAFVVPKDVDSDAVVQTIYGLKLPKLEKVTVFDVFEGESLGAGNKSIALRACLRSETGTLGEAEIKEISNKIIAAVAENLGGKLREA